jgi:hypothetical protein
MERRMFMWLAASALVGVSTGRSAVVQPAPKIEPLTSMEARIIREMEVWDWRSEMPHTKAANGLVEIYKDILSEIKAGTKAPPDWWTV